MIRVCIIAVLAFVALVVVTRNLPDSAFRPAPRREAPAPPARVDALTGAWEGTLQMRRMDGASAGTLSVRQVRSIEPGGLTRIAVEERGEDGALASATVEVLRREDASGREMFERTERREGAPARLWIGRMHSEALVWSWEDPASGEKQSFREELLRGGEIPVLAVDGAGVRAGEHLLFAGRFRQVRP